MSADQFTAFRKRLHRGVNGHAYYWTPDTNEYYTDKHTGKQVQSKWSLWFPADANLLPPKRWPGNIFYGVHPVTEARKKWQRSTIDGIAAINCVFAEVDGKDMVQPTETDIAQALAIVTAETAERVASGELLKMTPAKALYRQAILRAKETIFKANVEHYNRLAHAHVMSIEPKPSAIIASGGGYHLYTFLRNTYHLHTPEDRERAKQLQARWVEYVGGDDGAKDLARVLRPVGTQNRKPKYAPNYPTVSFIHLDYSLEYNLEELEALLPQPQRPEPKPKPARTTATTEHAAGAIDPQTAAQPRGSIPAIFNATYSLETLLTQYGYTQYGNRWMRPGGSDSPGVEMKDSGRAVIWSSNDPLWNEDYYAVTAFDAYMIWEHDGDFPAAQAGAAQLLGLQLTLAHVARPIINQVREWLTGADLSRHVADEHKAQRRLEDGTTRAEYRSGHNDKLTAALVLDIMHKAGRAQDVSTYYRRIAEAQNSAGISVSPLTHKTVAAALTRLAFMFDVIPMEKGIKVSLRREFLSAVVEVDLIRFPTEYLNSELGYLVGNLTQTTLDYMRVKNDDAFLTGTARPVKERMKRVARECGDIAGVTYPELMATVAPGLSTFAPAIITTLIEAGGSGCTYDDLCAASGASLGQARKIVRGLRASGLESHRQYKAPSIHFLPADAYDRIAQELAPTLKTYGLGVHRLDKQLEHRQRWAEEEVKAAKKSGNAGDQSLAEKRVALAQERRLKLQPLLHPERSAEQHKEQVYITPDRRRPWVDRQIEQKEAADRLADRTAEAEALSLAMQRTVDDLRKAGRRGPDAYNDAIFAGYTEREAAQIAAVVSGKEGVTLTPNVNKGQQWAPDFWATFKEPPAHNIAITTAIAG